MTEISLQPRKRRRDVKQRGVFERPKGSGVFWIRYYVHGHERREKVGSKQDAIDRYQQRKVEARNGTLPGRNREVLLSDFVTEYLANEKHRMRSFRNYERHGRVWSDRFSGRTLRSILPLDIERWIARRAAEDVTPATINRELSFLRRVFNVALANDLVDRNPMRRIKLMRENNARVRWLTDEEEARLRAEVGEEHWPLVAFALHTGLRQAEQFRLRWADVDLVNLVLTVPRSKHGETRHVHLNETAVAILRDAPSRCVSDWVFPSRTGATPLEPHNFLHRVFMPALGRAAITGFRWHDLRHTFASRLVMAGADLPTVKELMGHKTLAMTLRYSHLSTAHRVAAVRMLDAPAPSPEAGQTGTKPAPAATDGAA
jgi:site-specific recombinase XerD